MKPCLLPRLLSLTLASAAALWLAPALRAQSSDLPAGSLDATFNVPAGALPPGGFIPYLLFPTPDGGVLVGGTVNLILGPSAEPDVLLRLRADGSRDDAFHARLPRPDGLYLQPVAVDAAGRALVFQRGGPGFDFTFGAPIVRFLRLRPDGSVDPTFEGPVPVFGTFPPGGPGGGNISRVLPLPDGSLLVAGRFTSLGGQRTKFAARLRADGSVDPAVRFRPPVSKSGFADVFIQPDAKVVITDTSNRRFRYNADGSPGFPPRFDAPSLNFYLLATGGLISPAFQADGKVFGETITTSVVDLSDSATLMRLNPDGTLDGTFNAEAEPDLLPAPAAFGPTVVQPDGRILVTPIALNHQPSPRLYRLFSNGRLDASFNAPLSVGPNGFFTALAVTPDGNSLFVAGLTMPPGNPTNVAIPILARLRLADPQPPRANLAVRLVNPTLAPRAAVAGGYRLRAGLRLLNTGDESVRNIPLAAYLTDRTDYGTTSRPFREAADPSLVKLELLPTLDAAGNLLSLKLRLPGVVGGNPAVSFIAVRKLAAGRPAPLVALKLNIAAADLAAFRGKTLLLVLDPAGTTAPTGGTDNVAALPIAGLP